jgi:hypothetical protein
MPHHGQGKSSDNIERGKKKEIKRMMMVGGNK